MPGDHEAPTANSLGAVVTSPVIRAWIYGAYVVLLLVVGSTAAYLLGTNQALPPWVIGSQAVLTYLGVPVGGLAIANIVKKEQT